MVIKSIIIHANCGAYLGLSAFAPVLLLCVRPGGEIVKRVREQGMMRLGAPFAGSLLHTHKTRGGGGVDTNWRG